MRTTIDLPDDLLRRAKVVAALRGVKLKDLIASFIEMGLKHRTSESEPKGQQRPIPVSIPSSGRHIRPLTNAEMEEVFLREDLERLGLSRSY